LKSDYRGRDRNLQPGTISLQTGQNWEIIVNNIIKAVSRTGSGDSMSAVRPKKQITVGLNVTHMA
jgi:hypothetical protein